MECLSFRRDSGTVKDDTDNTDSRRSLSDGEVEDSDSKLYVVSNICQPEL